MTRRDAGVSVVIPARNDAAGLPAAVESVLRQQGVGEIEVVIAVGPSSDETAAVARSLASRDRRVRVVDNPAGSTAAGLNRAVRASMHPVVARVDARSTLVPGYLAAAVDTLSRTGAANVGGRQRAVGVTCFERAVAVAMGSRIGSGAARYRVGGRAGPTDTVYLGVFRRDALEDVGGFDESLQRNQDYELNWRLRSRGWCVWFDPALHVQYRPRSDVAALARQYWWFGRWKRVVLRRYPTSTRLRQLLPPATVSTVALALVLSPRRPRLLGIPVAYGALVVASGLVAARGEPWRVRPLVPAALATMHLSWGAGFLVPAQTRQASRSSRNSRSSASMSRSKKS